jgi:hypothetical protein
LNPSLVNKDDAIEEEIQERIVMGNEALHMNASVLRGKLMSKSEQLKLYNPVIKPVKHRSLKNTVKKSYRRSKGKYLENIQSICGNLPWDTPTDYQMATEVTLTQIGIQATLR